MFRKIEAFSEHKDFITEQQTYFSALPNIIPSFNSGLPGFDKAIHSADTLHGQKIQPYAIDNPNSIFMPTETPELREMAKVCRTTSVDDLIRDRKGIGPNGIGCGWVYTAPPAGSPYPVRSVGALGDRNGPIKAFNPPSHRKWFGDLEEAKQTALIDKCKALQSCNDIDIEDAVYKGVCGFCTDQNQGVPINGSCNTPLITSKSACPLPPDTTIRDTTCDLVNGRLSIPCLQRTVITAGCDSKGTLYEALSDPIDVKNPTLQKSISLYEYATSTPFPINNIKSGNTTVLSVLKEVGKLSADISYPVTSAKGASSRDLCIRSGIIDTYDKCIDVSDSSNPSTISVECLQRFFKQAGGTENGSYYPTPDKITTFYNTQFNSLGEIKQFWNQSMRDMKNKPKDGFTNQSDSVKTYKKQSIAAAGMKGIELDDLIKRAPLDKGVEVFWFTMLPGSGNPAQITSFLRRTFEEQIIQYAPQVSSTPQTGMNGYAGMLQLTDLDTQKDFAMKMGVNVDDGFWIAVNQPADIDKYAMRTIYQTIDKPGFFENIGYQGPTQYNSQSCTSVVAGKPNIMKLFHEDAGGGGVAFQFTVKACSGAPTINSDNLRLTCERTAPFLTFEVSDRGIFEELRNPGIFNLLTSNSKGINDVYTRTDVRSSVPGKKSFMRLNSASSLYYLTCVAYQSWKTMTVAVRFQSKPINESIINMAFGAPGSWYCNLIAFSLRDGVAGIRVEYRIPNTGIRTVMTNFQLTIGTWYLIRIENRISGFTIYCDDFTNIDSIITTSYEIGGGSNEPPVYDVNATWNSPPGYPRNACDIMLGTADYIGRYAGMYASGQFFYDVAWIHFFDGYLLAKDIKRECLADWIYTQFITRPNGTDGPVIAGYN